MGLVYVIETKKFSIFSIAFRGIADMFSVLLLTTETHIHSKVIPHGICVGQNGCDMWISMQFVSNLSL